MFKVGDYVVHANNGICKVEEIGPLKMQGASKEKKYISISPIEEDKAMLYIPEALAQKRIRLVMNQKEAMQMIDKIPEIEETYIDNDKERERAYKDAVSSCNPELLISIIKTMYHRCEKRSNEGKKNTMIDERYFKCAENNLYAELAFATGKKKEEMKEFIADRMNGQM